jgi:hypothetical protein
LLHLLISFESRERERITLDDVISVVTWQPPGELTLIGFRDGCRVLARIPGGWQLLPVWFKIDLHCSASLPEAVRHVVTPNATDASRVP